MQQTQNYKLNLIETSDTFSPAPLNENMEKLETAITAGDAALDARVTLLEARKIIAGFYTGTGVGGHAVQLEATPVAVLLHSSVPSDSPGMAISVAGSSASSSGRYVNIIEGGFVTSSDYNAANKRYNYIAIL